MVNDFFSFVRNAVDIVDVVGRYVSLRPAGNYLKGLSPFQSEKTPSFTVSPGKKIFYCFSSNTGGDVIEFVARVENCNNFEAAMILINQYNIIVPKELIGQQKKNLEQRSFYFDTCLVFAQFCYENFYSHAFDDSLDYMKKRGFSDTVLKAFSVGYCPQSTPFYTKKFIDMCFQKSITISEIIKTGILYEKKEKGAHKKNYIFAFEDRIIFPIKNTLGIIVGFGGRVFRHNDNRAKYINTNASSYFSKKDILYGLSIAREEIKKTETVYLVEGYMDTLAMYDMGFHNTVCTMGTACTGSHIDILERITKKVIAIYDGDEAGQNALLKLTKMCWNKLIEIEIVELGLNTDPADMLIEKDKKYDFLKNSLSSADFFIKKHERGFVSSSLKEKKYHLEEIIDCLSFLTDLEKQSIVISEISNTLNIPARNIYSIIESKKNKNVDIKEELNVVTVSRDLKLNEWLIFVAFLCVFFDDQKKEHQLYLKYIIDNGPQDSKEIIKKLIAFKKNALEGYNYLSFFDILDIDSKKKLLDCIGKFSYRESHLRVMYCTLLKKFPYGGIY